ncbi:MAG TPA: serine protease [Bacteroidota bacterium]|nr:serine protease [Bacteroidota bacterium]
MRSSAARLMLTLLTLLCTSCSSYVIKEAYPTLNDGMYDSEFPYRGCSQQLEEIAGTVKRVTVMAHYKVYSFGRGDSVRLSDLTADFIARQEPYASFQHYSTAGTSTMVYAENGRIALLTCAHIVDFSDTVIARYVGADHKVSPFLQSVSIKISELVFLPDVGGGVSLDILAFDRSVDLALLGQKLEDRQMIAPLHIFAYPLGRAKELEWGSFVYVFGYPAGYKMVTKGIVSPSGKPGGSFVVDAVMSPGSSGSIALAIRDGVPNFELVGIIKMIPAQTSYVLTPEKTGDVDYDPVEPYHGEVFVQRKAEIQQGIAVAIPTETVLTFLQKNTIKLVEKGYDLTAWLNPPPKTKKAK